MSDLVLLVGLGVQESQNCLRDQVNLAALWLLVVQFLLGNRYLLVPLENHSILVDHDLLAYQVVHSDHSAQVVLIILLVLWPLEVLHIPLGLEDQPNLQGLGYH